MYYYYYYYYYYYCFFLWSRLASIASRQSLNKVPPSPPPTPSWLQFIETENITPLRLDASTGVSVANGVRSLDRPVASRAVSGYMFERWLFQNISRNSVTHSDLGQVCSFSLGRSASIEKVFSRCTVWFEKTHTNNSFEPQGTISGLFYSAIWRYLGSKILFILEVGKYENPILNGTGAKAFLIKGYLEQGQREILCFQCVRLNFNSTDNQPLQSSVNDCEIVLWVQERQRHFESNFGSQNDQLLRWHKLSCTITPNRKSVRLPSIREPRRTSKTKQSKRRGTGIRTK